MRATGPDRRDPLHPAEDEAPDGLARALDEFTAEALLAPLMVSDAVATRGEVGLETVGREAAGLEAAGLEAGGLDTVGPEARGLQAGGLQAGGRTVGERAAAVLVEVGGLRRLARMSPRELARHLPAPEALRVACALELGRRAARVPLARGRPVRGLRDVEPHLRGLIGHCLKEVFVVVLLDAKNRPIRTERVSEGCLTWSVVHPREVFAPAVRESAGAILVAHNHPSGDPTPSRQDVEVTGRLARAGETLGIPLLDHVIVGAERAVSMRAEGLLEA